MNDVWVCHCMAEYDNRMDYDIHSLQCETYVEDLPHRDVIQDIMEGKPVSILDPEDPLDLYLYGCPDCSPEEIHKQMQAAVKCALDPSAANVKAYEKILSDFDEHLATHQTYDGVTNAY